MAPAVADDRNELVIQIVRAEWLPLAWRSGPRHQCQELRARDGTGLSDDDPDDRQVGNGDVVGRRQSSVNIWSVIALCDGVIVVLMAVEWRGVLVRQHGNAGWRSRVSLLGP